jgi:hypothetical protein
VCGKTRQSQAVHGLVVGLLEQAQFGFPSNGRIFDRAKMQFVPRKSTGKQRIKRLLCPRVGIINPNHRVCHDELLFRTMTLAWIWLKHELLFMEGWISRRRAENSRPRLAAVSHPQTAGAATMRRHRRLGRPSRASSRYARFRRRTEGFVGEPLQTIGGFPDSSGV